MFCYLLIVYKNPQTVLRNGDGEMHVDLEYNLYNLFINLAFLYLIDKQ